MKKITLCFIFLILLSFKGQAQCIRTYEYLTATSTNLGVPQNLTSCAYTTDNFIVFNNVLAGQEYIFTCKLGNDDKYITVTNIDNTVIAHGTSPLSVANIGANSVKLHFSDSNSCDRTASCHDVTAQIILTCPIPTAVNIGNITDRTADFSWEPGANESSWQVAILPAASPQPEFDATQGIIVVSDNSDYSASGLLPGTSYKFHYRAVCSPTDKSPWNSSDTFTTGCESVATFFQNFDASTNLPNCWIKVGAQGNAYVQSSDSAPSLPNHLNISSWSETSRGIIGLPFVSNANDGTHRLKFKARPSSSDTAEIEVGYVNSADDPESFVLLQTFNLDAANNQTVIFQPEIDAVAGEILAIRQAGPYSNGVYIDDVSWEIIPNCPDVDLLVSAGVNHNSAEISWTGNGETQWQLAYGPSTVTNPDTLTAFDINDFSEFGLTDLSATTAYKVWVRSNCGDGAFGVWVGPIGFTTSCEPVTAFSQDFDSSTSFPDCWSQVGNGGSVFVQSNFPTSEPNNVYLSSFGTSYGILALQPVSNASAGTHRLKFKSRSAYDVGGVVQVGYLANYNDASSFVPLQSFTTTSISEYDEFTAELGSEPETGYLALRHSGSNFNAVYIDDVTWELSPNCEDVTALANEFITNNAATVTWSSSNANAWQVVYGGISVTDPSTLIPISASELTYTFSPLQPDTDYKYWVRSDCGNGQYGAWIGPKRFKTNCNPVTELPWTEGFENATTPDFPACWTKENGDFATSDATTYNTAYTGTKYLRNSYAANNEFIWTPGFTLQANTAYDFSAFVQGDGFDNWTVAMFSNNSTTSAGATQLGQEYQVPGNGNVLAIQPYAEMQRTFTPTSTGIYYFAIRVNDDTTAFPWYVAFDNFSVKPSAPLANRDFSVSSFQAYPNPVIDFLTISYDQHISEVAIFNLLGQLVKTKKIEATKGQLDMSDLSAGSYLVKLTAGNQSKTIKIIKQ